MTFEERPEYVTARKSYWDAQRTFREVAVAEARWLMTQSGVIAEARFDVDDNGAGDRLILDSLYDSGGIDLGQGEWAEYDEYYACLDQIGMDMEVASWDEGKSFLPRDPSGTRLVIHASEPWRRGPRR